LKDPEERTALASPEIECERETTGYEPFDLRAVLGKPLPSKAGKHERFEGHLLDKQGQNQVSTVLYVPYSSFFLFLLPDSQASS
jgi:hypothetical protein